MTRLLPLIALCLIALFAGIGLWSQGKQLPPPSPLVGTKAAPLSLPLLEKSESSFSSHAWEGKVAVVNFFASWCLPCAAEHPALMALADSHAVAVYGVAWKDTPEKIAPYLAARGNPFTQVGIDTAGGSTVAYGLTGVPETFIIDRHGMIAAHYKSALTEETVTNEIIPLTERLRHE